MYEDSTKVSVFIALLHSESADTSWIVRVQLINFLRVFDFWTEMIKLYFAQAEKKDFQWTFNIIVYSRQLLIFGSGMSSPLSSLAFVNAIVFGVHGTVAKQFDDQKAIFTHFIAGTCAGIAQAFIAAPTELLKVRVQVNTETKQYRSPYHCLRCILKESGARTLFR